MEAVVEIVEAVGVAAVFAEAVGVAAVFVEVVVPVVEKVQPLLAAGLLLLLLSFLRNK